MMYFKSTFSKTSIAGIEIPEMVIVSVSQWVSDPEVLNIGMSFNNRLYKFVIEVEKGK
jgi:hypothetical protein